MKTIIIGARALDIISVESETKEGASSFERQLVIRVSNGPTDGVPQKECAITLNEGYAEVLRAAIGAFITEEVDS